MVLQDAQQEIEYRPADLNDVDWLLQLRMTTMANYIKLSGQLLGKQDQLNRILHAFENIQIIIQNQEDVGMMKVVRSEAYWKLVQIQLLPVFQKFGLGTKIIIQLIENASLSGKPLELSVLKVNPAKRLYDKLGFYVIAENEGSYEMRIDP